MSNTSSDSETVLLDDYLDEDACAAELDLAPITLATWRMQKKGPPVTRIGRRIYYKKSSLREWLASQEEKPRSAAVTAKTPVRRSR